MRSLWIIALLSLTTLGALGFSLFKWNQQWREMQPSLASISESASTIVPAPEPAPEAKKEGAKEPSKATEHGGEKTAQKSEDISASLLSVGEMVVSLGHSRRSRMLSMKLELELFGEEFRNPLDHREPVIKNAILEFTREQDPTRLESLPGKLLFKEGLVSHINEALGLAAIRQVHFESFVLE
jgi:flagellar basal body-associated protein FliL